MIKISFKEKQKKIEIAETMKLLEVEISNCIEDIKQIIKRLNEKGINFSLESLNLKIT